MTIGDSLRQGFELASTIPALHTDSANTLFENTGLGVWHGHHGKALVNNLLFRDDIPQCEVITKWKEHIQTKFQDNQ